MKFARPDRLSDALSLLGDGDWDVLSGGTDFYPGLSDRPVTRPVLDISALPQLREITETESAWRIGALATWSDVIAAKLPPAFDALKLSACEIGSVQIQNRATLAGNICNASPAADGVPPLLVLDAVVELASTRGTRDVPLAKFIQGNRVTDLQRDELMVGLRLPKQSTAGCSTFLKLGARKYLVISITMAAVRLACDEEGTITDAAVSVGACSAVARRLPELEAALMGQAMSDDLAGLPSPVHFAHLSPISDVRASAEYRQSAAITLVRRTLTKTATEHRA